MICTGCHRVLGLETPSIKVSRRSFIMYAIIYEFLCLINIRNIRPCVSDYFLICTYCWHGQLLIQAHLYIEHEVDRATEHEEEHHDLHRGANYSMRCHYMLTFI